MTQTITLQQLIEIFQSMPESVRSKPIAYVDITWPDPKFDADKIRAQLAEDGDSHVRVAV